MKSVQSLVLILVWGSAGLLNSQTLTEYPQVSAQLEKARQLQADFQFSPAIEAYLKLIEIIQGTDLVCLKYEADRQITFCLIDSELPKEAVKHIHRSLEDFDDGDCRDTVRLSRLYTALYDAYQADGMLRAARQALDINKGIIESAFGPESSQMASLLYNYASLYGQQGANYLALESATKSMQLRRKIYRPDEEDYFKGFYAVANYAERIGDYERAYLVLDSLIQYNHMASKPIVADAYHLMSLVCIRRKEFDIAVKYAELSLELFQQMYGADSRAASFAFQELGMAKTGLRLYDEAQSDLQQAYQIRKSAFGPDHRLTLSSLTAFIQARMAATDTLSAIDEFKATIQGFIRMHDIAHAEKYAFHTVTIGSMYEGVNQQDSALKYYLKAETIANQYYEKGDRIHAQTHLALAGVGSYPEKMKHAGLALFHLTGNENIFGLTGPDLHFAHDKYAVLELYHKVAGNIIKEYQRNPSIELLDQVLSLEDIFEMIQNEIFLGFLSPQSVIASAPLIRDIGSWRLYAAFQKIQRSGDQSALSSALRAMEVSKNILLNTQLYSRRTGPVDNVTDSLIHREKQLYLEIRNLSGQYTDNDSLHQIRLELEKAYLALRRHIKLSSQKLFRAFDHSDLDLQKLQLHLKADELWLDYFLQDTLLYILQVSRDQAALHTIETPSSLYGDIQSFLLSVRDPHSSGSNIWVEKAYSLKHILLPMPIPANIRTLTILPDNELFFIPFDILLDSLPHRNTGYRDLPYLIKRYSIAYLPTINASRPSTHVDDATSVFFAPFITQVPEGFPFARLPNATHEKEALVATFGSALYLDEDATESAIRTMSHQGGILHIASHALLNADRPLDSKILLFPNKATNNAASDGDLTLWELYQMDLGVRMAVLSACQSADGVLIKGAGIRSLSDGFYVAGVNQVVSNLWQLQDYAASAIVTEFYRNLKSRQNPAIALRNAKLHYLKTQNGSLTHPVFWGGWIYQGPTESLESQSWRSGPIILITVALLILFLALFLTKKSTL